jgi:hypothetical protein
MDFRQHGAGRVEIQANGELTWEGETPGEPNFSRNLSRRSLGEGGKGAKSFTRIHTN